MASKKLSVLTAALLLGASVAVRADVTISNKPTSNMDCESGVCTATAQKAVLNASDLANMLATGDVAVKTGTVTKDIDIDQPLSWSSTSRLTLDAQESVTIKKQITVAGTGALTVVTNDNGQPKSKSGEFIIVPEHGSVQFWDTKSSLIIDGSSYTLVNDIKTLAADIAANPSGFYALAKPYDASVDGTYKTSPIPNTFSGLFEGLGNNIFRLNVVVTPSEFEFGFFQLVGAQGTVRDFGLANANIAGGGGDTGIGVLVGENAGLIFSCWASSDVSPSAPLISIGGLAAGNDGVISRSFAVTTTTSSGGVRVLGGLVAGNSGIVSLSYAKGSLTSSRGSNGVGGGLVGDNDGAITDAFSLAKVHSGKQNCCEYGGLIGKNENGGTISNAYAAGDIHQNRNSDSLLGGLVGYDAATPGSITNGYWVLDKGVSDPSQGAGNIHNDPGIEGLTTKQLQSGLPKGFDPKVWAQEPGKNQGLPYLRALALK